VTFAAQAVMFPSGDSASLPSSRVRTQVVRKEQDVAEADSTVDFRNLGDVLVKQDKLAEARKEYESAIAIDKDLVNKDAADRDTELNLALDYEGIGKVFLRTGNKSAALASLQTAVSLHEGRCKADPSDANAKNLLADSYVLLGDAYTTLAQSAPKSRRPGYLETGCSAYGGALKIWSAMQTATVLNKLYDSHRSSLVEKMQNCN
jgi:tetratricopeptide (TPR) repeat protein